MATLLLYVMTMTLSEVWTQQLSLQKCCGDYETLDARGLNCVGASWPRNATPHDAQWLSRWVPPGLPLQALGTNFTVRTSQNAFNSFDIVQRARASTLWSSARDNKSYKWDVVMFDGHDVRRLGISSDIRRMNYCVDAAPPPMGPFIVRYRTYRLEDKYIFKCCPLGQLLATCVGGDVLCASDPRGWWSPRNSSALSRIDPDLPYGWLSWTGWAEEIFHIYLESDKELFLDSLLRQRKIEKFFSTWLGMCADFYRDADGSVRETLAYNYSPRPARGAYWLTRNLSFVAILLLATALWSVVKGQRKRTTVHGWALASHGSCLLLFNFIQVIYYFTISDEIDDAQYLPDHLAVPCLIFGFTAYFLLTAAGCWLTCVCANMAHGFRSTQGVRGVGFRKRAFARLSVLAWGTASALTAACLVAIIISPEAEDDDINTLPWYRPSMMETRTCFLEMRRNVGGASVKWGTLLYYYAPMSALVLCNAVCLGRTARRVHGLRRGNSLLRRDREAGGQESAARKAVPDAQSLIVYLKLLLSAGVLEMATEGVAWAITRYELKISYSYGTKYHFLDHAFAYRTAGYCADVLRAAVVLWLSAPQRGALRALWHSLRGESEAAASVGATEAAAEAGATAFRRRRPASENTPIAPRRTFQGPRIY